MGTPSFLWNICKSSFTFGLIGLTISDRFASIVPVRGFSMSPTFNPDNSILLGSFTDDHVLVEKHCLKDYKFSLGDVVVFCSPSSYKEKHIKRITAMPGDWISVPYSYDAVKIPEGHCWVEGDNPTNSLDSRSFGPIPLGLIRGRATHIVWPPQRVGKSIQSFLEVDLASKVSKFFVAFYSFVFSMRIFEFMPRGSESDCSLMVVSFLSPLMFVLFRRGAYPFSLPIL
ncbi:hypothetical protein OSB04_026649 [Centaurea solstitialis]|uniref:Mitochondrial inner membrane protease subunit 2 n=1 Tax=Centaurea solstitialis TaxID=347529 RepID=A0AA38SXB6_9ASTR|nr:hypothetical protein OSB04_026649 [Centaurea solstitialis]